MFISKIVSEDKHGSNTFDEEILDDDDYSDVGNSIENFVNVSNDVLDTDSINHHPDATNEGIATLENIETIKSDKHAPQDIPAIPSEVNTASTLNINPTVSLKPTVLPTDIGKNASHAADREETTVRYSTTVSMTKVSVSFQDCRVMQILFTVNPIILQN